MVNIRKYTKNTHQQNDKFGAAMEAKAKELKEIHDTQQSQHSGGPSGMNKGEYIKRLKESQSKNSNDSAYCRDLQKEIEHVKRS